MGFHSAHFKRYVGLCAVGGRTYLRHILALKTTLVDILEGGGVKLTMVCMEKSSGDHR
jgi:hypothetical protein